MLKAGDKKIFKTNDTELKHLNGKEATILKVIDEPDKKHDADVLPMYVTDLKHDDKNVEVFPDELV